MYAIIEESGGQRKVQAGDVILIDLIEGGAASPGKQIKFDKVLLLGGKDGGPAKIGAPYVPGAHVIAEVVEGVVQGDKLRIQYFQPKKGSRRRTGHRQRYTRVKVSAING
jgi:large subunit ribosomal protein L21